MGYKPRAEIFDIPSSIPTVKLRADIWRRARGNADKLIIKAQKRWAQAKRQGRTFKEGDMVWLEGRNLHIDQPMAKLSPKRHGPFPIKKVLGVMTTRDYDSDANFFSYYFPITTPSPFCLNYYPALFSFCLSLVLLSQPRLHSLAHDS